MRRSLIALAALAACSVEPAPKPPSAPARPTLAEAAAPTTTTDPAPVAVLGQLRWRFGSSFSASGLAHSPDGRTIAVGKAWPLLLDARTGVRRHQLLPPEGGGRIGGDDAYALAFSPDSKLVAVAEAQAPLRLFEVATGKQRLRLDVFESGSADVCFAPDGRSLAASTGQGGVLWCAVKDGVVQLKLAPKGDVGVASLGFARAGKALAVGYADGSLRVVDRAGAELWSLPAKPERGAIAIAERGRDLIVVRDGGRIERYDRGGGLASSFQTPGYARYARTIDFAAIGPRGRWVALADAAGVTRVDLAKQAHGVLAHPGMRAVAFSPDGRRLATLGACLRRWRVDTLTEDPPFVGHEGGVVSIVATRDRIVTAGEDGTVRGWSLQGRPRWCVRVALPEAGVPPDSFDPTALSLSSDGEAVAVGDMGWVAVFEVATGKRRARFHLDGLRCKRVLFKSEHNLIVGHGRGAGIHDAKTGELRKKIQLPGGFVPWAYAPAQDLLVARGSPGFRVFDLTTGAPAKPLPSRAPWGSVAIHPKQRRVAFPGEEVPEATVSTQGALTVTRRGVPKVYYSDFAYGPGGRLAASTGREVSVFEAGARYARGTLRLPAVACGLATAQEQQPGVSAVALNEDLLVLAFDGGLVAAWRIADLRP